MLLPLYLGVLHAVEPDHVAVVTGVSLSGDRRGAWKVGLAFGASHMLAVALIAVSATFLGRAFLGDTFFLWMDRLAWGFVLLLGLWNLAAAFGLRTISLHSHEHRHGLVTHEHPHPHVHGAAPIRIHWVPKARPTQAVARRSATTAIQPLIRRAPKHHAPGSSAHRFHHSAAWLGAFFGLGGVRGFTSLMKNAGITGQMQFIESLLLFGLGITVMFTLLSALSGWLAARLGTQLRFRRTLYALSGVGNVAVGLYLLLKA
jgi:ABC-type nickel/cobalt efflux system permease component RcnA